MKPWYYVLTKATDGTVIHKQTLSPGDFRKIIPIDSVAEYDDVRWIDLTAIGVETPLRTIF